MGRFRVRKPRPPKPPKPQPGDLGYEDYIAERNSTRVRRALACGLVLGMIYGAYWFIMYSEPGQQMQAIASPMMDQFEKIKADPKKAWSAIAVFCIAHMGIITFIFDDRYR